jgi:hypothetical protein
MMLLIDLRARNGLANTGKALDPIHSLLYTKESERLGTTNVGFQIKHPNF